MRSVRQHFTKRSQKPTSMVKTVKRRHTWESVKASLSSSVNPAVADEFISATHDAVEKNKNYPVISDLMLVFNEIKSDHSALRNYFNNLFHIEKKALPEISVKRRTEESYANHPDLKKLGDYDDGIPALKNKALKRIEALQNDYFAKLVEQHKSKSREELFEELDKKINLERKSKKGELELNYCEKMELQTEIRALRKAINPLFSLVFIPNRGPIAKKIGVIAAKLGFEVVMIAEENDRYSQAAQAANQFLLVSEASSREEVLEEMKKFMETLPKDYNAGVQPGYGYFSEDSKFVEECQKMGIVFNGPDPIPMEAVGDKREARKVAQQLGVPVVPGYDGDNQDRTFLLAKAKEIGFPLMIKTTDGGGGTGNRLVRNEEEARSILMGSFENKKLILEKYLKNPKHIEVQYMSDGRIIIRIGTRDCSLQRRYQKILEFAPAESPKLDEVIKYGDLIAEHMVKALGYKGAGTVEFLLEEENGDINVYFNEINPRVQVEHGPSEDICGNKISIIAMLLHIFAGGTIRSYQRMVLPSLPEHLTEQQVIDKVIDESSTKVSVEARINAESYVFYENQLHSQAAQGKVTKYVMPLTQLPGQPKRGIIDSSIALYDDIDTTKYNSNIELPRGWGANRNQAVKNLLDMLEEMQIEITNNKRVKETPTNIEYHKLLANYLLENGYDVNIETCKKIIDGLYYQMVMNKPSDDNVVQFKAL